MNPVQLDAKPKSSPKVIVELYYFPSSNRILTQEKKAKWNKIIASFICKVIIKILNNFLNNFNSYLFVPCCLLSLQLIKYSSFLHHFPLLISNDSFLLFFFSSFFPREGAETARLIFLKKKIEIYESKIL